MLTSDTRIEIRKFDKNDHTRDKFDCGHERLNNYLKKSASKLQKGDFARVYVAVEPGKPEVLGYHSINFGTLDGQALEKTPRDAPTHMQLPVLFLGQIAVTSDAGGNGIGSLLLHHVFEKAVQLADKAGCWAIILDAVDDDGEDAFKRRVRWYETFGFETMPSMKCRMFITLKKVRAIVAKRKTASGALGSISQT